MDKDVAFHDLPTQAFPIKIEALSPSGEVVWEVTMEGPGALEVPPLRDLLGYPVGVRTTYADGVTVTTDCHEPGV